MRHCHLFTLLLLLVAGFARADLRKLMPEPVLLSIARETSGEAAKRNLDAITVQHRMRAGTQFDEATDHILEVLKSYGLDKVDVITFPADGETMMGSQKSRPVWEVESAQLWELAGMSPGSRRLRRLADWTSVPLSLAQDSLSGDVTAELVAIGEGTAAADYAGLDVAGKLVLTSSQPEDVVAMAITERGAVGIVSYAPNQKSAWWKEDDRLVRWGHMSSFPDTPAFGFMVSLAEARSLQQRLAAGEAIVLQAQVRARHKTGKYRFATALIKGNKFPQEEIHYSCHLDHPRPGANDNASGCVAIMEVARTLSALIAAGELPRPARSLRFLWPAEIEGTIMYLAGHRNPQQIKANIHMDMVGGAPVTKSVFRISGGPMSVPSFISDLGHEIGNFVSEQTLRYADGEEAAFPLVAPEGGKEPLLVQPQGLDMGSDHDVFFEGSWRIPGLYVHEWPDRYIHTNFDLAANIDPTKLKRAAFVGAASGWYLANLSPEQAPPLLSLLQRNALARSAELLAQRADVAAPDAEVMTAVHWQWERGKIASLSRFLELPARATAASLEFIEQLADVLPELADVGDEITDDTVYRRNPAIQGPMFGFGYSYLEDNYGSDRYAELELPGFNSSRGSGRLYQYEALNLVDGRRSVSEIRSWLTAELGPVPLGHVAEYLDALASIGVLLPAADSDQ